MGLIFNNNNNNNNNNSTDRNGECAVRRSQQGMDGQGTIGCYREKMGDLIV